ncbi:hypothetical protein NDA16_003901 [Ustilago loliicola]|nr:hypothetical protein NDA16_003901 [Ustilago loliicola]
MAELVGSTPNPREPHALKSLRSMLSALSSLTRLCDQKFVTCSYSDIPIAWRAIYVDTQLLKACCALSNISEVAQGEASTLRRYIRDLDLALIVAGAASLSKDQLCHDLIASLQTRLLDLEGADQKRQPGHHGFDGDTRTRKRLKSSPSESWKPTFTTSAQADLCIPEHEFDEAPTFMDLSSVDSTVRSKPFIIRGYAQRTGWPALQSDSSGGSWSSIDHLLNVAGPARVVPVEVGANYTRGNWGQDIMLWSDFLQQCHWEQPDLSGEILTQLDETDVEEGPTVLYMAQHDLASQFPALQRDYSLPDYVYTSPPAPKDWPDYKPPVTYDGVITNLWVGPAGTISPPHHDPYYNCFVQAVGYKEVWVSPPHLRKGKVKAKAKAQASKSKKVGAGRNQNKGSSKGSAVAKAATGGAFFGAGARLKNGGGVSAQSVDAAALSDDVTPPGAGTTTPPDAGMTPDPAPSTTPVTTGGSDTPATNNCTTTMPANNNNNNITTTIPPDSGNGPVGTEEPCPLTHNSTATAFPIPPFFRHMDKSILTEVCQFLVNSILPSSWTSTSTWSSTTPTPITVTASATPSPVA